MIKRTDEFYTDHASCFLSPPTYIEYNSTCISESCALWLKCIVMSKYNVLVLLLRFNQPTSNFFSRTYYLRLGATPNILLWYFFKVALVTPVIRFVMFVCSCWISCGLSRYSWNNRTKHIDIILFMISCQLEMPTSFIYCVRWL